MSTPSPTPSFAPSPPSSPQPDAESHSRLFQALNHAADKFTELREHASGLMPSKEFLKKLGHDLEGMLIGSNNLEGVAEAFRRTIGAFLPENGQTTLSGMVQNVMEKGQEMADQRAAVGKTEIEHVQQRLSAGDDPAVLYRTIDQWRYSPDDQMARENFRLAFATQLATHEAQQGHDQTQILNSLNAALPQPYLTLEDIQREQKSTADQLQSLDSKITELDSRRVQIEFEPQYAQAKADPASPERRELDAAIEALPQLHLKRDELQGRELQIQEIASYHQNGQDPFPAIAQQAIQQAEQGHSKTATTREESSPTRN